jgi:hypothetical protein
MMHPVPRGDRSDLIAAVWLVALLVGAMTMAARALFFS